MKTLKKIMFVFGTRPEAVKMCPLIKKMMDKGRYELVVCLTGQHKEMLLPIMTHFDIKVDYNFELMQPNQTLSNITTKVLLNMQQVLSIETPDLVLVHGDTSSAYATALCCFYNKVPVGHVEAGLRTYDVYKPFPEEFNRQAIDKVASLFFVPTKDAANNLYNEKISAKYICITGNTVIDSFEYTIKTDYEHQELIWAADSRLILVTMHRRENWGKTLEEIFSGILRIVEENKDIKVIYPVHKNPVVIECAHKILGYHPRIHLISPLDVLDFHNFLKRAYLVVTDSGGIQEEAPTFSVPVLVARDTTERPEGIEAGIARIIGTSFDDVYSGINDVIRNRDVYEQMRNKPNPYGDGMACERIINFINTYFEEK